MSLKYRQRKRNKHKHSCKSCKASWNCTQLTTCEEPDGSIEDKCTICEIRSPEFQDKLNNQNKQIRLEMEYQKVWLLSIFDNNRRRTHDHVFRKKQEAINYFKTHYPANLQYKLEKSDLRI